MDSAYVDARLSSKAAAIPVSLILRIRASVTWFCSFSNIIGAVLLFVSIVVVFFVVE